MKKILVPTDLSVIAERGLKLATEIAERSEAEIYLVNFTRHPFGRTFTAMGDVNSKVDQEGELFTLQMLRLNKQKLDELGQKYSQHGVDILYDGDKAGFRFPGELDNSVCLVVCLINRNRVIPQTGIFCHRCEEVFQVYL